ncbi:tetratricopeptide repeat protein [Bacillus marinisedimentorum]|uniref:tetratricopeptide repeat protein n=1 Tax=Bacillus marinisedimentorum TaxID=1821260 RepID=UPI0008729498|nr:tetratricopeptide repeat protein [Bacillus marinisedimentorum]
MARIEEALQFIQQGDAEKGLFLLEEINKNGTHEEQYEIARTYYELGLADRAKAIVESLLLLYPDEGELYMFSAELLIDLEQEDEALDMLNEVKESDPVYVQALLLMADLYQMQGLDEVAEQKLLAARRIMPDEPIIDFGLGEFYLAQGDYQKSIPAYRRVLESQDKIGDVNVHLRLAEALSTGGDFDEALAHYEKGLGDKLEINALFGYAFTAFQAERYRTAIQKFEELKDIDPAYTPLYLFLAKAYEEEGANDEAYETIKAGLEQDEFNKEMYYYAAQAAVRMKNQQEAETFLKQAIALDPGYTDALIMLSDQYFKEDRHEDVIDLLEHAGSFGETDPRFEWYLARAKNQMEYYGEALNHYESAYTFFKENASFLAEYGAFLLEEGRRPEALKVMKSASAIDPDNMEIQDIVRRLTDELNN